MASNRRYSFVSQLASLLGVSFGLWSNSVAHAQRVATSGEVHITEAQRVTIDVNEAPLTTVLYTIARQAGLTPFFNREIIPSTKRVTLHLREVTARQAFEHALQGTGLVADILSAGNVTVIPNAGLTTLVTGIITGRVVAATTQQPLAGANVGIDGTDRVTETDQNGSYQLTNINSGLHTVTVKLLGYTKMTRTVMVQDNTTVTADIVLVLSATPLDQVVVTGTVVQTELKAVPNAMTVITAKDIEQRGITHIDQLFRGDVPGVFSLNTGSQSPLDAIVMFSRGATALSPRSVGAAIGDPLTNPIKTYIDGVEVANSKYLSQIDPKSIERIEILTGPQASTIYGSNAINGVMQIFTKRGTTSKPQLTLNLLSGFVQNNSSSALTPQHDYSAQLSGVEGRLAYNAGGAWNYMGPWTPAKQMTRTSSFGGTRLDLPTPLGRLAADMTLRRSGTQSLQHGLAVQRWTDYRDTGWWNVLDGTGGVTSPTTYTLTSQTLGLTLSYTPVPWWSHELGVGRDASDTEQRITAKGYISVYDTTLQLTMGHADRRSLHYSTTARISVTSFAQATVTTGADAWQSLTSSFSLSPQTLTGTLTSSSYSVNRQPGHNTGAFLQTQFGMKDRLFFTYGLRAEWNPDYGDAVQPNYAPRYGVAYTEDVGPVTAKLRASYGRSTRPPAVTLKQSVPIQSDITDWGPILDRFANPELGPEYQQGGEGGLELYLGTRGSLVVTRYNQTVDQLIASVVVDSADIIPALQAIYGSGIYWWQQSQYLNIGSIRNQGWELQGSINTGPLTTKGTYSWTKSRTIGVNPKYRSQLAGNRQYQPGATFDFLPEHTWAVGVLYGRAGSSIGLNVMGTGRLTNVRDDFYTKSLDPRIRLQQSRLSMNVSQYISFHNGYALADLTASQQIASRVEGILQVQNLADQYVNDYYAAYATLGRQVKMGFRLRL